VTGFLTKFIIEYPQLSKEQKHFVRNELGKKIGVFIKVIVSFSIRHFCHCHQCIEGKLIVMIFLISGKIQKKEQQKKRFVLHRMNVTLKNLINHNI